MARVRRDCLRAGKQYSETERVHGVKWRHSNLWSRYHLYVVRQHGALYEFKWGRLVALLE